MKKIRKIFSTIDCNCVYVWKYNNTLKKKIIVFILVICGLFTKNINASVASENVTYTNSSTSITNVKGALDELYTDLNSCKSGTANASKILSGYKAYYNGALVTGTIPSKAATTYTPGTSNQTISSGQYLSGTQTIKGDSNLVASNIKCGTAIFGVTGTHNCTLYDKVSVGQYVKMTPAKNSFTVPKTLTGYDNDQTINPSELNLWRVIRKNSDGTIEMVSEYVSSTEVYFKGQTGYLNFVGTLNLIASAYENRKYTSESRHMGCDEIYSIDGSDFLTNTSKYTNPAPWTSDTENLLGGSGTPSLILEGAGDLGYKEDETLVKTACGNTLVAKKVGTSTARDYWLASRYYFYVAPTAYSWIGRYVDTTGNFDSNPLYEFVMLWTDSSSSSSIRPIVTLKSGITASSGSGTNNSPWILN